MRILEESWVDEAEKAIRECLTVDPSSHTFYYKPAGTDKEDKNMSSQHKVPCFWTWLCVVFSPFSKGASKMPWIQKDRLSLSLHFDCPAYFHTLEKLCDITDFLGKVGNRLAERWQNKPRCPHRGLLSPDLQEELQWDRWERRAERKAVEQTDQWSLEPVARMETRGGLKWS